MTLGFGLHFRDPRTTISTSLRRCFQRRWRSTPSIPTTLPTSAGLWPMPSSSPLPTGSFSCAMILQAPRVRTVVDQSFVLGLSLLVKHQKSWVSTWCCLTGRLEGTWNPALTRTTPRVSCSFWPIDLRLPAYTDGELPRRLEPVSVKQRVRGRKTTSSADRVRKIRLISMTLRVRRRAITSLADLVREMGLGHSQ